MPKPQPIHNVNGKAAYRITAKYLAQTEQAYYMDCEGDKHWFPKTSVRWDAKNEKLDVQDWLYKVRFPKG